WVDDLVKESIRRAGQYDHDEQWVKSMRLYAGLGSVEPAVPQWKDKLKLATRRVRLLALYTPDILKNLQDSDSKERDEVDHLLNPTTQPSKKNDPSADNDSFKIDWRETLKGINMEMLREGLAHAEHFYYRDASYKDMALGGIKGLQAVVNTRGLEKTFPKLADPVRKRAFVAAMEECIAANRDAAGR